MEATADVSSEAELAGEVVLEIFDENSPLKPLAEQFGRSTADALTKQGQRWFWKGANDLWNSARDRVSRSGRTPKDPRVEAAIEITKHGAAEERQDLREAYENLAARSMTEDEWGHDYEEYARRLSRLKSGDIDVLGNVRDHSNLMADVHLVQVDLIPKSNTSTYTDFPGHERTVVTSQPIVESSDTARLELMGTIDRLVSNRLLLVGISDMSDRLEGTATTGQNIDWPFSMNDNVLTPDLSLISVAPTQVGIEILKHVANLEQADRSEKT